MLRRFEESISAKEAQDRQINGQLLDHQIDCDWVYSDASREIQLWMSRFIDEFRLNVACPALGFGRLRGRCGHYRLDRNDFGLNSEIKIDVRHLAKGLNSKTAFVDVLRTTCHELIHMWEHLRCGRDKGGRYHTNVFRKKAEQVGLMVDQHGYSLGIVPDSPFTQLLDRYGVTVPEMPKPVGKAIAAAPTKLKLYECRCVNPFKLRIARADARVRCEYCGAIFEHKGKS